MKNKGLICLCLCLAACANTKLEAIRGQDEAKIKADRGTPMTVVTQNGRQMWTYRQEECTELIFFDDKGQVDGLQELGTCLPKE